MVDKLVVIGSSFQPWLKTFIMTEAIVTRSTYKQQM